MRWRSLIAILLLVGCDDDPRPPEEGADPDVVDTAPFEPTGEDGRPPPTRDGADPARVGCVATATEAGPYGTDVSIVTYGAFGEPLLEERDDLADGVIDSSMVYTYGQRGHLVSWTWDWDGPGEEPLVVEYAWIWDTLVQLWIHDGDVFDQLTDFEYDDAGELVRAREDDRTEADRDSVDTYTRTDGEVVVETDDGPDGAIDRISTWTYDGDRLVATTTEEVGDPTAARATTYTYDPDGWLVLSEVSRPDGALESRTGWVRDALGRELVVETDEGGDGSVEARTTTTWSCR